MNASLIEVLCMSIRFTTSWLCCCLHYFFFFSSRRRHTRYWRDWSSDVCSSDLETLKALIRLFEPGVQPGATEETAGAVVLGDEATEEPVEVLHRLDQAERAAMPVVDGDVLETRSQARRGQEPVAGSALEGEVDARHLIEVVEDHQCRRVVDQRDPAGLQPAALLPAREQPE